MFNNKIYMSSTTTIRDEYREVFGIIESLSGNGVRGKHLIKGWTWCLDNGVYVNRFEDKRFIRFLTSLEPYRDNCLFVACPDVLYKPDETRENFFKYYELIKEKYNYPIAYILQDGFVPENLPYDLVNVFFVGGSTEFKLSNYILDFVKHCNNINKWIHIGRVNSIKRLKHFKYADSWDGTHLSFAPSHDVYFYDYIIELRKEFE